jgi:hypothetical protein
MDEVRNLHAISGIGHAKAESDAALLREMLPPYLLNVIDLSFLRSHVLYDEFVYRLVLKVIRDTGLEPALREGGSAQVIAARERLDAAAAGRAWSPGAVPRRGARRVPGAWHFADGRSGRGAR